MANSDSSNEGNDTGANEGQQGSSDSVNEQGYPEGTPVADMTAVQQAAYWKAQSRKHESRVKGMGDYESLKAQASEYQKLVEANRSEQEKAVEAAKAEGRNSALAEFGSRLVEAQITAASTGRLSDEQRSILFDGLDRSKFLTADGVPDVERINALINGIAPKPVDEQEPARVDMGQGRRNGAVAPSLAAGANLYAERHNKN